MRPVWHGSHAPGSRAWAPSRAAVSLARRRICCRVKPRTVRLCRYHERESNADQHLSWSRRMTDQPAEPQPAGPGLGVWDGPGPEEPTDAELFGLWPDPFAGPPDGDDAWAARVSDAELDGGFAGGGPL